MIISPIGLAFCGKTPVSNNPKDPYDCNGLFADSNITSLGHLHPIGADDSSAEVPTGSDVKGDDSSQNKKLDFEA